MSRVSTAARARGSQRTASCGDAPLALVGADDACERIRSILEAAGFECATFPDAQALSEGAGEAGTLVVCREDTSDASIAQHIEPLRAAAPDAAIVLVCTSVQRWEVRAALAAGVDGVVMEDETAEALALCIRAVGAGQICVPRSHGRQVEPPVLSTREKQILGLVVMGYMNSQIAERLYLAESTVKSHLSSAFGKLGVRSRNEAVNLILDSKRGLGMGILALGGEPLQPAPAGTR